ncbi:MAG: apolipoprotein N-acyltransferase [Acidobacteriota bacterium]
MARARSKVSSGGRTRFAEGTGLTPFARWAVESPRRRFLLSAISGVALAYAFPRNAFEPVVFVALAPLIVGIVLSSSGREAFTQATFSSAVTWLINVPWVIRVMSYYGGLPLPLSIALYVVLCVALGMFSGVFLGLGVYGLRLHSRPLPWLLVPLSWVSVEYGRTYLLTGFPWNQLASALIDLPAMIQIDRWIGPYAVGFLVMVPATLLAWLMTVSAAGRTRLIACSLVLALLSAWFVSGALHLRSESEREAGETRTVVALIQPNISQQMRWGESTANDLFLQMMQMTRRSIEGGAKVIVWPESSVPLSYFTTDIYREAVETISRTNKVDIILGSVAEDAQDPSKLWNAAYLISDGRTVGRYDKIKLVPFGEYVPLRKVFFFADKLVHAVGDFQFGTSEQPLKGRFLYGPAICYEVVYPQITLRQIRNGATVLVTISNDGWYTGTAALAQHMNQARLRAVEGDRYLFRSTTSGISAFVDPTGRMVASLPDEGEGIVYARFAGRTDLTPYVRYGDWFAMLAVVIAGVAILWRRRLAL